MRLSGALLCLLAPLSPAQNNLSVEGTVSNSVTRAGIGEVQVRLWTRDANTRYDVMTDAAGVFRVTGMKEGEYRTSFEKRGFVPPGQGELWLETIVRVGFGKETVRLDVKMAPWAALSGRVVDGDGKAAGKVEVEIGPGKDFTTDDEGRFTFENLEPGTYRLRATPPKAASAAQSSGGERMEMVPTYFPSVMDPAQAERIRVSAGDHLSGYEIRLRAAEVHRVRGVVVDEAGKPVKDATVRLVSRTGGRAGFGVTLLENGSRQYMIGGGKYGTEIAEFPLTGADGHFEFPSVPAGEWRLDAEAEAGGDSADGLPKMARGSTAVIVEHEDLGDVQVSMRVPFPLNVEIEGEGLPQGVSGAGMLALGPVGGGPFVRPLGRGGSVFPGRYRIESSAPGYYLAAATLGGRDVLGQTIDLMAGSPPLHVVLKRATSGLRGTVEKGEGASVLIWPQNAAETTTITQVTCGPQRRLRGSAPPARCLLRRGIRPRGRSATHGCGVSADAGGKRGSSSD
jgi:hypothetical protein